MEDFCVQSGEKQESYCSIVLAVLCFCFSYCFMFALGRESISEMHWQYVELVRKHREEILDLDIWKKLYVESSANKNRDMEF